MTPCGSCISSPGASAAARSSSRSSSRAGSTRSATPTACVALGLGFDGERGRRPAAADASRRRRRCARCWLGARALRRDLAARAGRRRDRARRPRGRGRGARAPARAAARSCGSASSASRRRCGDRSRRLRWRAVVRRVDAAVALTPDLGDELRRLGFRGPIWAIPNFRDPEPFVAVDRDAAARDAARRARHRRRRRARRLRRPPDRAEAARPRARHARPRCTASASTRTSSSPATARCASELRARRRARAASASSCTCSGTATTSRRSSARSTCSSSRATPKGCPGVLIEAQMAGCPIVTVPVGGVRDLVDDGETGVVTDEIDPEELATRVVGLLRDPKLRTTARRAGRGAVRSGSRPSARPRTYAARLAEIAPGRGRRPPRPLRARRPARPGPIGRLERLINSAQLPSVTIACNYVRIHPQGDRGSARSAFPWLTLGAVRAKICGRAGRTWLTCLAEQWGGGVQGWVDSRQRR